MTDPDWTGDGEHDLRALQLPARARQPDGPHPRGVRARLEHRPGRAERIGVRRHPRRHHRHRRAGGCWTSNRRRSGSRTCATSSRGSRAGSTAGRSSTSRRRRRSASTSEWRRPAPEPREGDRSQGVNGYVMNTITPETERPATTSGRSSATTASTASSSRPSCATGCTASSAKTRPCWQRAAGGHRRQPGLRVLQPQHRRGRHVGASPDRAAARGRGPDRRRPQP